MLSNKETPHNTYLPMRSMAVPPPSRNPNRDVTMTSSDPDYHQNLI